jgi:hypothetical protein
MTQRRVSTVLPRTRENRKKLTYSTTLNIEA